jgi:hypothetical protein
MTEDEMGGAFSTERGDERYIIFWLENVEGLEHSENLRLDEILEWILGKEWSYTSTPPIRLHGVMPS